MSKVKSNRHSDSVHPTEGQSTKPFQRPTNALLYTGVGRLVQHPRYNVTGRSLLCVVSVPTHTSSLFRVFRPEIES